MGSAKRGLGLAWLCLSTGCLAAPPRSVEAGSGWKVRSNSGAEAEEVRGLFERLEPRLDALLPDWQLPADGQIWIQEQPKLYAFPLAAKSEAEGLWAEEERCILLARGADSVERTLAHEMVHAGLGRDWDLLPGSLEEGLCDYIAANVCPEGGVRLRAGRLSSALLALGGLELDLRLHSRNPGAKAEPDWQFGARIRLSGEASPLANEEHLHVFRLQAGLSTTDIGIGQKRNYYGLAYLLVDRLVGRIGLEGLYALCREARSRELSAVPRRWLLEAAGLGESAQEWRAAALSALGSAELTEILRMYPDFVIGSLAHASELYGDPASPEQALNSITAELRIAGAVEAIDAARLEFIELAVEARLRQRRELQEFARANQLADASKRQ